MATIAALKHVHKIVSQEKPNSAVSEWIDRLCSERYQEDEYEGIPELVDAINLQSTGPTEASRAIRKKFKYSNVHGQLRAWTILNALVENCGSTFQTTFANDQLVERIKTMAADPATDKKVKKKLLLILLSWNRQFQGDPKMSRVTSLFTACGGRSAHRRQSSSQSPESNSFTAPDPFTSAKERQEEHEHEFAKAREEKDKAKAQKKYEKTLAKERLRQAKLAPTAFNFQKEKPKIMETVATATQASQSLLNALQLVNPDKESVTTNVVVQEKLAKAKQTKKTIVRYIQIVENDPDGEYLGMLINANEQLINSLDLYNRLATNPSYDSDSDTSPQDQIAATTKRVQDLSLNNNPSSTAPPTVTPNRTTNQHAFDDDFGSSNQYQQPQRQNQRNPSADLQDLVFNSDPPNSVGTPIQPVPSSSTNNNSRNNEDSLGANLSDYSDYDSSDDDVRHSNTNDHNRGYRQFIQTETDPHAKTGLLDPDDDPFADPSDDATTPGVNDSKRIA